MGSSRDVALGLSFGTRWERFFCFLLGCCGSSPENVFPLIFKWKVLGGTEREKCSCGLSLQPRCVPSARTESGTLHSEGRCSSH